MEQNLITMAMSERNHSKFRKEEFQENKNVRKSFKTKTENFGFVEAL